MTLRGKVVRDLTFGPGLLMIEGHQYHFCRENWMSQVQPRPGLVVDAEVDASDNVRSLTVVPEAQLAREQAERLQNRNPVTSLLERLGWTRLSATGLLFAAWLLPTAVFMQVPFPGKLEFTFWQMLAFLNTREVPQLLDGSGSPDAGLYGMMAVVALAGPFAPSLWKSPRALLGGLLPLGFMVGVGLAVHHNLQRATDGGQDPTYAEGVRNISLGLGAYVSLIVALLFVFWSLWGWVAARTSARRELDSPQRKAA